MKILKPKPHYKPIAIGRQNTNASNRAAQRILTNRHILLAKTTFHTKIYGKEIKKMRDKERKRI